MSKRIQRKRSRGWKMPDGAVYVGRPTYFGNPWTIRALTDLLSGEIEYCIFAGETVYRCGVDSTIAAEKCVALFRSFAMDPNNGKYRDAVKLTLRGRDLACWCRLDKPCHADVLLQIANDLPPAASASSENDSVVAARKSKETPEIYIDLDEYQ